MVCTPTVICFYPFFIVRVFTASVSTSQHYGEISTFCQQVFENAKKVEICKSMIKSVIRDTAGIIGGIFNRWLINDMIILDNVVRPVYKAIQHKTTSQMLSLIHI